MGIGSVLGRRVSVIGTATALFLMLCVLVVSSRYEPFFRAPTHDPRGPDLHVTPIVRTAPSNNRSMRSVQAQSHEHSSNLVPYIVYTVMALFALLLVIMLVVAATRAIRRFRNPLRRFHGKRTDGAPIPDVLDEVSQTVSAQRSALTVGAPRNAIIDCWISLEHSVDEAGVSLRASETSAELVIRVIDELDADSDALGRLGHLYRCARFSSHEITEDDRAAARDALEALDLSLREASRARGSDTVSSS